MWAGEQAGRADKGYKGGRAGGQANELISQGKEVSKQRKEATDKQAEVAAATVIVE